MRSLIAALALAALPASAQEEETAPAAAPVEEAAAPAAMAPSAEPAPATEAAATDSAATESAPGESKPGESKPTPRPKPKRTRRAPAPAAPAAPTPDSTSVAAAEKEAREKLEAFHDHVKAMDDAAAAASDRPLSEEEIALSVATDFIHLVIAGDARSLVDVSAVPFFFEGTRLNDRDAVFASWLRAVREKRVDLLTLYGVELYTPDEMEKKYGKPPARLASLPWRGPNTWIAVANVSGRAAVLVLKEVADMDVRVVGYTD